MINLNNNFNNLNRTSEIQHLIPQRDFYSRQDPRVEYQLFSSEYFSAADVKLYFGDIWVDEITNLQFQIAEQVFPIFGYNSYTYDAVARGTRLVNGSFSMNFTSVGYLNQVIENASAIEYAIEQGESEGLLPPKYYENKKLSEILALLGKESFDQIADEYEEALWGTSEDTSGLLTQLDRPYFRQDDIGFDIRIQYGAVSESSNLTSSSYYEKSKVEKPNVTVEVVNGVQVNLMQKLNIGTDSEGTPIQEVYYFSARDLNGVSSAQLRRL